MSKPSEQPYGFQWKRAAIFFGLVVTLPVIAALTEESKPTATAAPVTSAPSPSSNIHKAQVVATGQGEINSVTSACMNSEDLTVSSGRTGYCRSYKAGDRVFVAGEGVGLYCVKDAADEPKCQWVPKHVVNFASAPSGPSSLSMGGVGYPRVELLNVVVDQSLTTFETSGYMTVADGSRAMVAHKARESASLAAYIGDLPVDLKKSLVSRCNFGRTCRVVFKGRRFDDRDAVRVEQLTIQSSMKLF